MNIRRAAVFIHKADREDPGEAELDESLCDQSGRKAASSHGDEFQENTVGLF